MEAMQLILYMTHSLLLALTLKIWRVRVDRDKTHAVLMRCSNT